MSEIKKTAIFYDYDNIYISIDNYYTNSKRAANKSLFEKIEGLYDNIDIKTAYGDMSKLNDSLDILDDMDIHMEHIRSSNSKNNGIRKNASDIKLVIDIIKSLYGKNFIDKYVIVSADSDMLEVVREIKNNGREVEVIYFEKNTSKDYIKTLASKNVKTHAIENLIKFDFEVKKIDDFDFFEVMNKLNNLTHEVIRTLKLKGIANPVISYNNMRKNLIEEMDINRVSADNYLNYLIKNKYLLEHINSTNPKMPKIYYSISKVKLKNVKLDKEIVEY